MKFLQVLVLWLVAAPALSADWHLLELDEFSLESAKIVNMNEPYFAYADPKGATTEHWDNYAAVRFNLDLVEYERWGLYWNNTVDEASTNRQVRTVSWAWEMGLNLHDRVQLFWDHHSSHVLDAARDEHFPLENRYGIRAILYKRSDK